MRVGAGAFNMGGVSIDDKNITEAQNASSKAELEVSLWETIKDWFLGTDTLQAKKMLWELIHSAETNPSAAIGAFMWLKEHAGASYQSAFNMSEVIEPIESPPDSGLYQTVARIELSIGEFKVKTGACSDFLGEKAKYLEYIKEGSGIAGKTAAECIEVLESDVDRLSFLLKIGNDTYSYGPGENSPIFHLVKKTETILDAEVNDVVQKAYENYKQSMPDPEALTCAKADGIRYKNTYEEKWRNKLRKAKADLVLNLTDRSDEQIINMAATCSQGVPIAMYNDKPEYFPVGDAANSNTLYKLTEFPGGANIMTMSFTKKSLTPEARHTVKEMSDMMNEGQAVPVERKCNFEMRATFLVTKAHTYCVKVSWIDNDEMTTTVAQTRPYLGATGP